MALGTAVPLNVFGGVFCGVSASNEQYGILIGESLVSGNPAQGTEEMGKSLGVPVLRHRKVLVQNDRKLGHSRLNPVPDFH